MKKGGTEHIGICFNFDPHDKPGSHWVAAMLDLKEHVAYYYDSYGKGPPEEINRFFERCKQQGIKKILFNDIRHQRKMSECGMYSIYFMVAIYQIGIQY
jgi:Ulp1 family protease